MCSYFGYTCLYLSFMFLSVVIPCYNVKPYFERTVRCLDAQTFRDFEVILVDDGSTDGTLSLLERVARDRENYRVFSFENAGLSEARNRGLKYAVGEYVYFLDADDYFLPVMFQRMVELVVENDRPDAVRCGALWVRDGFDEKCLPKAKMQNDVVVLEGEDLIRKITYSAIGYSEEDVLEYYKTGEFPYNVEFSPVWIYFYRKSTLDKYNVKFVKGLQLIEDRIFNVTFAAYAKKVVCTNDQLYFYIITPNGLMARINRNYAVLYRDKVEAVKQRECMRELYIKTHNIDIRSSFCGSNVMGCLQVALILANLPLKESICKYLDYVQMPSVRNSLVGFPLKGSPLKFRIPIFLLQHKCERIVLLTVRLLRFVIVRLGLRGLM